MFVEHMSPCRCPLAVIRTSSPQTPSHPVPLATRQLFQPQATSDFNETRCRGLSGNIRNYVHAILETDVSLSLELRFRDRPCKGVFYVEYVSKRALISLDFVEEMGAMRYFNADWICALSV